ncbi:MAG: hypothetical protein JWP38_2464 [Herbaspirillum sp.]|nr:hypothetical protein [Herbaspirillum sp.]
MATTTRPPRPSRRKVSVSRSNPTPSPTINKPLNANSNDVAVKLKRALETAQAGDTAGALVIALDKDGGWTADLAGQLVYDEALRCLIACRVLGACLGDK